MKFVVRVLLVLVLCLPRFANAQNLITNGGFETGDLSGWSVFNVGDRGGVYVVNGTSTPRSGKPLVGPASGNWFAVTDQNEFGVRTFSQAFTITGGLTNVSFDMFVNNWGLWTDCTSGLTLINPDEQCGRVDIIASGFGVLDTGAGVVANLYRSGGPNNPNSNPNPYIHYSFDLNLGPGTYILRFGEADTSGQLNMGVDNVEVTNISTPEPGSIFLLGSALLGLAGGLRRKLCP